MPARLTFTVQLLFTILVACFLIVPAMLSMLAGVTVNYFQGVRSGLTLQWVQQVLELYTDTIIHSLVTSRWRRLPPPCASACRRPTRCIGGTIGCRVQSKRS